MKESVRKIRPGAYGKIGRYAAKRAMLGLADNYISQRVILRIGSRKRDLFAGSLHCPYGLIIGRRGTVECFSFRYIDRDRRWVGICLTIVDLEGESICPKEVSLRCVNQVRRRTTGVMRRLAKQRVHQWVAVGVGGS